MDTFSAKAREVQRTQSANAAKEDFRSQDDIMDYFTRQMVDQGYNTYSRGSSAAARRSTAESGGELTITDSFGFVEKQDPSWGPGSSKVQIAVDEKLSRQQAQLIKQENARVMKWKEMLEEYPEKKHPKLKSRARKGIPDAIRGYAWQILIQGPKYLDAAVGGKGGPVGGRDKIALFKALMEEQADQKLLISIFKDVTRTMPEHIYFKDRYGDGQKALFCVLKCLALHEKDTSYVQGMGYMAAVLLTYMDMEDTVACMVGILRGFGMRDKFLHGMPGLSKAFYVHLSLLKKYMPKLSQHMLDINFLPQTYGSQWFMTIFSCNFPFPCIVRIWDIFTVEGRKILYRIALAVFKLNEKALLASDMEGFFEILREFQKDIEPNLLIKTALSFKFPGTLIDKLEKEYVEKPDKEIQKVCRME